MFIPLPRLLLRSELVPAPDPTEPKLSLAAIPGPPP